MSDALSRLCLFVTVVAVTNGRGGGGGQEIYTLLNLI